MAYSCDAQKKAERKKLAIAQTVFRSDRFFLPLLGANQRGPVEPISVLVFLKWLEMRALTNPPHLNYYRLLEQDLEACFRFVEPTSEHHQVHSVEFARIILMASSGVENALNDFAIWAQSAPKPTNILQHFASTHEKFPKFHTMSLSMPKYGLGMVPWQGWSSSAAPDWWTFGYNKIKHDRSTHPGAATLIRAIKAVGALQVLLLHYYRLRYRDAAIADRGIPELLVPWDREDPMSGASTLWFWDLPDDIKDSSTNSE